MIQLNPEDYGMPMPTNTGKNPTDLDELVLLKNKATIPAFESIILHCRTRRTMMMGYKLHVMTQASYPEDRANLPNGVYGVKTYTELHDGSHSVSVVLRNAIPDATPSPEFMRKFRRIAPPLVEEVWEHLQEMLDGGVIWPSQSPWCNAVVLVRKKDGGLRFCIDFRRLNSRTKKDAYPLPRMQETMESMVGTRFFSTMDLKSGFWQVKMAKDSQQYTAFTVGSMGVYEFLRMSTGSVMPQRHSRDSCRTASENLT